jgi:uncharacterized protein (TIGR03083 family)
MIPATNQLAHDIRVGTARVVQLFEELSPAEWERPAGSSGWSVQDLDQHLVEMNAKVVAAFGRPLTTRGIEGAREDLSQRYGDGSAVLLDHVMRSSKSELEGLVELPGMGRMPLGVALLARAFEEFTHTDDIGRALGRRPSGLDELAPAALRFLRYGFPWLVDAERLGDLRARYGFRLDTDSPTWLLSAADGEVRTTEWRGEPVDVEFAGSVSTFLLDIVLTKTSPQAALESGAVRIVGDLQAAYDLWQSFPLLAP